MKARRTGDNQMRPTHSISRSNQACSAATVMPHLLCEGSHRALWSHCSGVTSHHAWGGHLRVNCRVLVRVRATRVKIGPCHVPCTARDSSIRTCTARRMATEVASFMTPSPKTSEYSTPASSGRITCSQRNSSHDTVSPPQHPATFSRQGNSSWFKTSPRTAPAML